MIHLRPLRLGILARLVFLSLFFWGLLWGCAQRISTQPEKEAVKARGVTIVLPFFDMEKVFGRNVSVRNPVTSKVFVTGTIDEKAALYMTNALYRLIGQESDLKWGNFQNGQDPRAFSSLDLKANHVPQLQALARQKSADTMMVGYLYAFRNRSGGDFGVESPAHVSFELALINTESGRIMWQQSFEETQKSLSEDLLQLKTFLKRRGRWVSAQEMAKGALKEMLQTIPHLDTQ